MTKTNVLRPGTGKRHYNSSTRKAQARETRLRIAQAARTLFFDKGYNGATISTIARKAGVSQETVYAIFRNKRSILAFVLDIAVGGDDQPVKLLDRPGPRAVLQEPDPRRLLEGFSRDISGIVERAAPVFEVARIAAKTEPRIAERIRRLFQERLENMEKVASQLAARGPLREPLDEQQAAEILWAITSPDLYQLVTEHLGWSKEHYSEWLSESLIRLLLP